jgi:hypothetical protein
MFGMSRKSAGFAAVVVMVAGLTTGAAGVAGAVGKSPDYLTYMGCHWFGPITLHRDGNFDGVECYNDIRNDAYECMTVDSYDPGFGSIENGSPYNIWIFPGRYCSGSKVLLKHHEKNSGTIRVYSYLKTWLSGATAETTDEEGKQMTISARVGTITAACLIAATALLPAGAAAAAETGTEQPHSTQLQPPGEPPVFPYRDMDLRATPHLAARHVGEVWAGFSYGWECWTTGDAVEISNGRYNNIWILVHGYQNKLGYVPAAGLKGDKYGNWAEGTHIQYFPC